MNFHEPEWEAYQRANEKFANAVLEIISDEDIVWIHDYHLMLLPEMIRKNLPPGVRVNIGFFLHIPFPSSDIYGTLPVRANILKGLLGADLIGFHTFDYVRNFLSSATRNLGLNTKINCIDYDERLVKVDCFPIGIDPEKFINVQRV